MDFDKELSDIYPWMIRVARRYCWSIQDAEDLSGDTVYKMLVNREKFDNAKSLKPWCLAIMQNTYITEYNRKAIMRFVSYDAVVEKCSFCLASDLVIFKDVVATIHRCYWKYSCIDCVIYYAKGYSYEDISTFLNIPVGTVKSRISYGRKRLYRELCCYFDKTNLKVFVE